MTQRRVTSPYVRISNSRIHSTGAFAKRDIPKGTRIIEYVGEKLTKAKSHKQAEVPLVRHKQDEKHGAVYLFELNSRFDIDGDVFYNTAKFLNHSCYPNCETDVIRGQIWIIALRDIKKGEELTYNYGYGYEDYEDHYCRCGADNCMGYILAEDQWWKLKRKRTMEAKKRKMRNGKVKRTSNGKTRKNGQKTARN